MLTDGSLQKKTCLIISDNSTAQMTIDRKWDFFQDSLDKMSWICGQELLYHLRELNIC